MRYIEISSIAKAIHKKEIPTKFYDGMELLNPNSGVTSLVFEKDKNTVRIFTKDEMKKEWLTHPWGLHIGEHVDTIWDTKYKDIYIIDMPKLYPLSSENKKIVNEIVKAYKNAHKVRFKRNPDPYEELDELENEANKLNGKPKEMLLELCEFIRDYDPISQYDFDISLRNFMQTKQGELIMLDPVADKELIKLFRRR